MQSHGVLRGRHGAAFRLDRINLVNPHTIYRTEQTQAVDGIADGDSHQPRSALGVASPPETAAEERHAPAPRRLSRHRTASIAVSLFSAATAPLSPVEHETPEFADQVHIQVTLERGHQIQRVFLAHRPFVGALVDQRRKDVRDGGKLTVDDDERARLDVGKRMLDLQEQLRRVTEALAIRATQDSLTGLLNRGAIMEALDQEMARAQRRQQTLCVGLCDIDHFKRVNDTHGHLAGDAVLREAARRIEAALRPFDHVGRYGGEEFLILVDATQDQAPALFERIRHVFADAPFVVEQAALDVTISCGATFFTPPADERIDTALIAAADAALYRAKDAGRNRTVFAEAAVEAISG